MPKQYGAIILDVAVGLLAFYIGHWFGLALWVFFVICNYLIQLLAHQKVIMATLLSRLPDRCKVCHREIVDEGGVIDDDGEGIYHDACLDKLDALRARQSAGSNV